MWCGGIVLGALPYSKVRYVRLLRLPFSAHSSPKDSLRFCSVTQTRVFLFCFVLFCFCFVFLFLVFFFIKNYKFVTYFPHIFDFLKKSSKSVKKKKKKTRNFSQILYQISDKTHFVWNFITERSPFLCKISLLSQRSLFFCVWFLPHRMPLTLKLGAVHPRLFYIVVLPWA